MEPAKPFRAKVRMYRQGLGDCFLITLPGKGDPPFYMMIDCGVILGTPDAADMMRKVLLDIINTTKGRVDVLVITHEHWDHLSGFVQCKDLVKKLGVQEIWLAWTEDPADELGTKLRADRQALQLALSMAQTRMRLAGEPDAANEVQEFLEFFGTAGATTADALQAIKDLTTNIRFCRPTDAPLTPDTPSSRFYVLGPPYDEKMIKRFKPSTAEPETYSLDEPALFTNVNLEAPFDVNTQIPLLAAKQLPFFQKHYWGEDREAGELNQAWRTIDASWLEVSSSLALQLDSATNNTSLVLALELDGGDVLLFAADAQVGNWMSWRDLKWSVDGRDVSGPDLLARTLFYKVGHHGSHNATLREEGLELMKKLKLAMIPVDHEMAVKKRWGAMPLAGLEQRLNEMTGGRVLRIDQDVPAALAGEVNSCDLFYEVTF